MPYTIGGQPVQLSQEPRNEGGPVYVPLREVTEAIGGKITWDSSTKTAGATLNGRHARIDTDSPTFTIDGQPVNMSVPTKMIGSETWVPIEFFEKAFGVVAIADANTNTVNVNAPLRRAA